MLKKKWKEKRTSHACSGPHSLYTDLLYTSVKGTVPQAWESLKLEHLYIYLARLCGSLPNWNMPSLRKVTLGNNTMGGSLSDSRSTMTSLQSADLYDNGFCGCVPASWASNAAPSEAAKDLPAAVRASDGATKNKCGNYDRCKSTVSGVASLIASMTAIAAVAAAMILSCITEYFAGILFATNVIVLPIFSFFCQPLPGLR